MVVVPRSIFLVQDGDHRIELKANAEIYGIHPLNKMIKDSINVNVEEAALVNSGNLILETDKIRLLFPSRRAEPGSGSFDEREPFVFHLQ